MRNAIFDAIFIYISSRPHELPLDLISDVYKVTSANSSLRDLITSIFINIGTSDEIRSRKDELPSAFLVDCLDFAHQDGIVPFKKQGMFGRELWMNEKKDKVCDEHHVHNQEELDAAEEDREERIKAEREEAEARRAEEARDVRMGGVEMEDRMEKDEAMEVEVKKEDEMEDEREKKEKSGGYSEQAAREFATVEAMRKLRVRY